MSINKEKSTPNLSDNDINYQQVLEYVKDFSHLLSERELAYKALYNAQLDTLLRLAKAAEFKDDDTGAHLERMAKFSEMLSRRYGMSEKFCELILAASPMHDIGKIGIPDSILKKQGKLDAQEWELMRQHPIIGARILGDSDVPLFKLASEIALCHHERFNGTGYPNSLKGTDIPISARIVAIADFYDALTTERCYKKAFSDDEAFELIEKEKGEHFDPELVESFVDIRSQIIDMRLHINNQQKD